MADINDHGLARYIPAEIRREVRKRSKFGCVICRNGFYQYEHIDPPFENAKIHDPSRICCLCGSCHDSVTRGRLSKELVFASYQRIQNSPPETCPPPVGPLDFHEGSAELAIGELLYSPAVETVFRYENEDVIRVLPGRQGEPGAISATFADETGSTILQLRENEWIGSLSSWDVEVVGQRLSIRQRQGKLALQLRLDPPGRLIIERLDMRYKDAHILVGEKTYAVGRYYSNNKIHWVHAHIRIIKSSPLGAAIEFTTPAALELRDRLFKGTGSELATADRQFVFNSNGGILIKPLGIVFSSLCGAFDLAELAIGSQPLEQMRHVVVNSPEAIGQFISTGKVK